MTPLAYRRGGKGMHIRYTIVDTCLGHMLVGATDHGICALSFGDDDASQESFLRSEYPAAHLQWDDVALSAWVQELVNHLEGSQPDLTLPLDLQATTFQLRVWEELRKIPYGETRTYAQIAQTLGQPNAVRAVARACATNPVSVITPCHRVVCSDGSLAGYRWGLWRKQKLLTQERSRQVPPDH